MNNNQQIPRVNTDQSGNNSGLKDANLSSEMESATLPGNQKRESLRPQRKAKNRDAIQKHLNRDLDLLIEEKNEKKSSTKKAALNP